MSGLLGEVNFEELGTERVRCVETGHEMPAADKDWYGRSKKCRRALFDLCLAQQKPPMDVFEQSPICRDKVVCKITGDTLNKTEEAVWKHMNGKKFQRKLAQKEAEKLMTGQHENMVLTNFSMQHTDKQQIQQKFKQQKDSEISPPEEDESETQRMDIEDFEFWVPQEDYAEEFDTSYVQIDNCEHEHGECINIKGLQLSYMNNHRIDTEGLAERSKRKAIRGPGRFSLQKKSRKMNGSDVELSNQ